MKRAIISFAHYVPVPVVKELVNSRGEMADIRVERRKITIFFSDIKGFTTICEQLQPEQILTLLTEYFDAMEAIVSRSGGTILEFVGDAILGVWNAPSILPAHASKCLSSALAMNEKLDRLRVKWRSEGFPDIAIRCGVHTAVVFHGNIGSHQRLKYGVLGDGVNLASRLEELCKRYGTRLITTTETRNEHKVADTFLMRPVDVVTVKGKSKPTTLWEVVCERHFINDPLAVEICALQSDALHLFLNQKFKDCCDTLDLVFQKEAEHAKLEGQALAPLSQRSARWLRERAEKLIGRTFNHDWDGAEHLDEKHF